LSAFLSAIAISATAEALASADAPFLSASALAAADALGDFAFNSRIKNPTPSHRVAVSRSDFVKGPVKAPRPITEKVKVIHNERTAKAVKWFFCRFSIGSCCRPIRSNVCQSNRGKN
jgi:hypothetical protein